MEKTIPPSLAELDKAREVANGEAWWLANATRRDRSSAILEASGKALQELRATYGVRPGDRIFLVHREASCVDGPYAVSIYLPSLTTGTREGVDVFMTNLTSLVATAIGCEYDPEMRVLVIPKWNYPMDVGKMIAEQLGSLLFGKPQALECKTL